MCLKCAHPMRAVCCCLVTCLLVTVAIAAWVIYGWILLKDGQDDCSEEKDTRIAAIFMLFFCIFGISLVCCAVIALICVPIMYCSCIKPALEDPKVDRELLKGIDRWINQYFLDNSVLKIDMSEAALLADPCTICLDGYLEDTQAVKLKCGCIFHTACIIAW